jgi:nucleoside-diphosphate-sugar epimerase
VIIGSGDITKAITDNDSFTYFASGVSNSLETKQAMFNREANLLASITRVNTLVYFSTLSVYHKKSPYTKHKLAMEAYIRKNFSNYVILRIGNITWGNNPHTFINFFKRKLKQNKPIRCTKDIKYILNKKQFLLHLSMLPLKGKHTINIMGTPMTPKQVLNILRNGLHL